MERRLRIAVLMASAGSRLGGLETIAREFGAGLAGRAHEVTLVTGVGPGAALQADLKSGGEGLGLVRVSMLGQESVAARLAARVRGVHPSIVEARTFMVAVRRSRRAMAALRVADVISAHFEVEAVEASRGLGTPVVYYYPGPVDPRRLALCRPRRMVAISRMVAEYHDRLAERMALPPVDGVVVPGVREESIAEGPAPGVGKEPPEAIFTGRLDTTGEKRVEKLIEWWPRVVETVPEARLTLVGGGSALEALRREVGRRGLARSISLPGPVSRGEVMERLRRASLFVFPSSFETFGVAPLEALAAGLPVVASDIPALRESLAEAALLLPVEDDGLWISTLRRLLSDQRERVELATRGPARARQLTWGRQSAAYEAHLLAASRNDFQKTHS
ncbi:MAG: glycosyltransferase family 4 protein [Chloroflexia bacterium]